MARGVDPSIGALSVAAESQRNRHPRFFRFCHTPWRSGIPNWQKRTNLYLSVRLQFRSRYPRTESRPTLKVTGQRPKFFFPPDSGQWVTVLRIGVGVELLFYTFSLRRDWYRLPGQSNQALLGRDVADPCPLSRAHSFRTSAGSVFFSGNWVPVSSSHYQLSGGPGYSRPSAYPRIVSAPNRFRCLAAPARVCQEQRPVLLWG